MVIKNGVIINGHEAIDLGLSVKWADRNIGADSPSDYGDYFAWGETETKSEYTGENCKTCGKKMWSIFCDPEYDAATANWGGTWRLPTKEEIYELNICEHELTNQGGHKGYKITGPNGNSIFLPAAGCRDGEELELDGFYGLYWSATPHEEYTSNAYIINFNSYYFSCDATNLRDNGFSIRPVTE